MGALNFHLRPGKTVDPPLFSQFLRAIQTWSKDVLHPVTIDGTPADNELIAWDDTLGRFTNQTAVEAGVVSGVTLAPMTIAAGVITVAAQPTLTVIGVDTEGAAATDDLTNITNGTAGQIVILHTIAPTRDVTVKYNSSLICLNGGVDFLLSNPRDTLMLLYDGERWLEIGRGDNL